MKIDHWIGSALVAGALVLRLHEYALLLIPPRAPENYSKPRARRIALIESCLYLSVACVLFRNLISVALEYDLAPALEPTASSISVLSPYLDSITATAFLLFGVLHCLLTWSLYFHKHTATALSIASRTARTDSTVEELALTWIYLHPTAGVAAAASVSSKPTRPPSVMVSSPAFSPSITTLQSPTTMTSAASLKRSRKHALQSRIVVFDCVEMVVLVSVFVQLVRVA